MTPNGIDNSLLSSRTADKYQAHTFLKDFKKKSDSDNKINLSVASSINLSSDSNSLIPVSELVVPFSDRNEDRVELDMGNGIKLLTPFRYSNDLRRFTTIKWEMRDRNMNLYTNKFNDDKKFSSDIFKIISRENREGRENKTLYKFPFSQAMSNNSIFKVPVDGNNMSTDLSTDTKFVVAFSVGVGNECSWKEAEAKLEDKFFIFPCYQMSSFCIRSEPKQVSQNIQPCGLTIKTGTDGKMIMQFPPTCVEQNRDITYQIFRPAITSVNKSLPEWKPKLLIAVSDKICMKFTRNSLKTPIYLSFPLPENLRTPGVERRLIGFRDHRPFIIRMVSKKVNDEILYEVKGCDGAALAVVQVGTTLDTNILKTELDIFYGSRILCKIILFAKTTNEGSSDLGQLFALCVIQAEVDDTIENSILRRGFRCIYITDALCLNPLQRIRIQVSGGILSLTCDGLPVTNHFLTFLCESKENAIEFPVSVVKSGIPYAIVKFLLDIMSRGTVSEVHFEPYLPFKSFYKRTRGYAEHSM
ncbi:uncharacterized protein LOC127702346 [Mytilus californianus]|uniref:uncharacterized protein LOC127702346 n=1 Tax=Mytilus californianus TaxID=6549 RepID=UPI0022460ED6|nr:uncharacterized protein LOC127702346 [Mytilus californianus]